MNPIFTACQKWYNGSSSTFVPNNKFTPAMLFCDVHPGLGRKALVMDSIQPCHKNGNSDEDNTPHYTLNQPLWLDGKRQAQFLNYGVWRGFLPKPAGLGHYGLPYAKIRVFMVIYNGLTTSYIDYVDISRISPRVISDRKEVKL